MKLHEFLRLDNIGKSNTLYKEAVYIGKRKLDDAVAVLYQLDFFYVEVIYSKYRYNIDIVECYHSTDILDCYPEQVCIAEFV